MVKMRERMPRMRLSHYGPSTHSLREPLTVLRGLHADWNSATTKKHIFSQ